MTPPFYVRLLSKVSNKYYKHVLKVRINDGTDRISFEELAMLTGFDPKDID